jgi:uroporphyrinogen-III synthase
MSAYKHTVLLTRPRGGDDTFARLLEAEGVRVLHEPFIEILPPADWAPLDAALDAIGVYSAIALTSMNAAHFFFARAAERGVAMDELPPVYAVGPKTAEMIRRAGVEPAVVPTSYTARDLAAALGDVSNQFILQPGSDIALADFAEAVAAGGGQVNSVCAYRTVRAERATVRELERMFVEGEVDCVAFFSPSAVKAFAAMFPEFKQATLLMAAIGQTTASAVLGNGLRCDVIATEQTAEGLARAILARLASGERVDLSGGVHDEF